MKLLLEEQETIIRWDRKDEYAIVYTFDPPLKRKLKRLEEQFPGIVKLLAEDNGSVEYLIQKALVCIRKPRIVSEEEKARKREQGIRLQKRPNEGNLRKTLHQANE